MFRDKKITLGISGSLFAYHMPELVSWLKENEADVRVALNTSALEYLTPLLMSELSLNDTAVDMFTLDGRWSAVHIDIAQCDLFVIVPANKEIVTKLAIGMADDIISAGILATAAPVLIHPDPGLNCNHDTLVNDTIYRLTSVGYNIIETNNEADTESFLYKLKDNITTLLLGCQKSHKT